jgi:hypothetical protein
MIMNDTEFILSISDSLPQNIIYNENKIEDICDLVDFVNLEYYQVNFSFIFKSK